MAEHTVYEQLDSAIDALLGHRDQALGPADPELAELLETAATLDCLARPEFKAQLEAALLQEQSGGSTPSYIPNQPLLPGAANGNGHGVQPRAAAKPEAGFEHASEAKILPSLFALEGTYPVQRTNFAASVLLHAVVLGGFVASSLWMVRQNEVRPYNDASVIDISAYIAPVAPKAPKGGGGGGDLSKTSASEGQVPKFANRQLTPPVVVVRNPEPVLAATPTVVGPPNLSLPQLSQLGDPLSRVVPASNGTGKSSGMGTNAATGVGGGNGPGAGFGLNGGIGGEVYTFGGGISAPRPIYAPDPEYLEEARKIKYQGTVILWAIIGADGLPKQIRVQRSLGMGLDEKALQAVNRWRFAPAMKDGRPVAVQINIELNFRLY